MGQAALKFRREAIFMPMKQLLAATRAAGFAMALPEDFDDGADAPRDAAGDRAGREALPPSRALVARDAGPARPNPFRDWVSALWIGRATA